MNNKVQENKMKLTGCSVICLWNNYQLVYMKLYTLYNILLFLQSQFTHENAIKIVIKFKVAEYAHIMAKNLNQFHLMFDRIKKRWKTKDKNFNAPNNIHCKHHFNPN